MRSSAICACGIFAAALVAAGCAITAPSVRWRELGDQPSSRVVTPQDLIRTGRVLDVANPGQLTFRIDRSDPIVFVSDTRSYAKMLRLRLAHAQTLEIGIESWCDGCKPTAILWGETDLPVFNPRVTIYDAQGETVTSHGEVHSQERLWRNIPLKGSWRFEADAAGPYYVLVTSNDHDGVHLGAAGNIATFVSSPVGKLRLHVAAVR